MNQRQAEIAAWDTAQGPRPEVLALGDSITKVIQASPKAVFWSKGVRADEDGVVQGQGMLYVDMVLVDRCMDLSQQPYALVETIRTLIRIVLPFSVIIIVSLLTRSDNAEQLARFYVKMRTPVLVDREQDQAELQKSLDNPSRYQDKLLFPNSQFELFKWNRVDAFGLFASIAVVFVIIGMLQFLLHVGS